MQRLAIGFQIVIAAHSLVCSRCTPDPVTKGQLTTSYLRLAMSSARTGLSQPHSSGAQLHSCSSTWAPVPLRLLIAYGFMEHGCAKFLKGSETFVWILHRLGVPEPHLMAWLTILSETARRLCCADGCLHPTRTYTDSTCFTHPDVQYALTVRLQFYQLMAMTPAGAKFGPLGCECDLLFMACLAALVPSDCGPLSLNSILSKKR